MLIKVTPSRLRPARDRRAESDATYRLQQGAARVALDHQRERPMHDAYGRPLPLSTGLANGYSGRALERMARGRGRAKTIVPLT